MKALKYKVIDYDVFNLLVMEVYIPELNVFINHSGINFIEDKILFEEHLNGIINNNKEEIEISENTIEKINTIKKIQEIIDFNKLLILRELDLTK